MTKTEAFKIALVFTTADGGCGYCATALGEELAELVPEIDWDGFLTDVYEHKGKHRTNITEQWTQLRDALGLEVES